MFISTPPAFGYKSNLAFDFRNCLICTCLLWRKSAIELFFSAICTQCAAVVRAFSKSAPLFLVVVSLFCHYYLLFSTWFDNLTNWLLSMERNTTLPKFWLLLVNWRVLIDLVSLPLAKMMSLRSTQIWRAGFRRLFCLFGTLYRSANHRLPDWFTTRKWLHSISWVFCSSQWGTQKWYIHSDRWGF